MPSLVAPLRLGEGPLLVGSGTPSLPFARPLPAWCLGSGVLEQPTHEQCLLVATAPPCLSGTSLHSELRLRQSGVRGEASALVTASLALEPAHVGALSTLPRH